MKINLTKLYKEKTMTQKELFDPQYLITSVGCARPFIGGLMEEISAKVFGFHRLACSPTYDYNPDLVLPQRIKYGGEDFRVIGECKATSSDTVTLFVRRLEKDMTMLTTALTHLKLYYIFVRYKSPNATYPIEKNKLRKLVQNNIIQIYVIPARILYHNYLINNGKRFDTYQNSPEVSSLYKKGISFSLVDCIQYLADLYPMTFDHPFTSQGIQVNGLQSVTCVRVTLPTKTLRELETHKRLDSPLLTPADL
jgi:hypothetical protein